MGDQRRHAPATERNREPILAILREILPARGTVLEVASGTGEHAIHFASALPGLVFQPSDPDLDALSSIRAWASAAKLNNASCMHGPLGPNGASRTSSSLRST